MAGRWITKTHRPRHDCPVPSIGDAWLGSVWECDCGRRFRVDLVNDLTLWRAV